METGEPYLREVRKDEANQMLPSPSNLNSAPKTHSPSL